VTLAVRRDVRVSASVVLHAGACEQTNHVHIQLFEWLRLDVPALAIYLRERVRDEY
jgi:hypothetical protein